MSFFKGVSLKRSASRLSEEALYAQALREMESGIRRDGLWARALAECSMDQTKAAARYIALRVQSLKDEEALEDAVLAEQEEAEAPKHARCGGTLDRQVEGNTMKWSCRKCRSKGQFALGAV